MTVERMLPLYEGKMIHHFDHRWATYDSADSARDVTFAEKQQPDFVPQPRYWIREELVTQRLGEWGQVEELLGWRDICRSTDERTMITSTVPRVGAGHTMPIAFTSEQPKLLQSIWSSFVFDFVARQKVGGTHMTFTVLTQLAVPHPGIDVLWSGWDESWILRRADYLQSPESWTFDNRRIVRAELDAFWFHVFGMQRQDVDYVMDSFPIVRKNDETTYGTYRTKELILQAYDAMQTAIDSGVPYQSPFDEESCDV